MPHRGAGKKQPHLVGVTLWEKTQHLLQHLPSPPLPPLPGQGNLTFSWVKREMLRSQGEEGAELKVS